MRWSVGQPGVLNPSSESCPGVNTGPSDYDVNALTLISPTIPIVFIKFYILYYSMPANAPSSSIVTSVYLTSQTVQQQSL